MGDSCHCDIRISESSNLWCHSFSKAFSANLLTV